MYSSAVPTGWQSHGRQFPNFLKENNSQNKKVCTECFKIHESSIDSDLVGKHLSPPKQVWVVNICSCTTNICYSRSKEYYRVEYLTTSLGAKTSSRRHQVPDKHRKRKTNLQDVTSTSYAVLPPFQYKNREHLSFCFFHFLSL